MTTTVFHPHPPCSKVKQIDRLNLIKMAYMQLSEESDVQEPNKEFYQLLKYNEAILRNLPVNLIITDTEQRIKLFLEYSLSSRRFEY